MQLDFSIKLWPKQLEALNSPANRFLYGGQAGGGKSHLERAVLILSCLEIPGLQTYLFRLHYNDLKLNHYAGPNSFPVMLAPLIQIGYVQISDLEIRFANGSNKDRPFDGGSRIFGAQIKHDADMLKFQGAEMHILAIEEAAQIAKEHIQWLMSRMRVPDSIDFSKSSFAGRLPLLFMTSNPYGQSLDYLKELFINDREPCQIYEIEETLLDNNSNPITVKNKWQFLPASLDDNPSIDRASYIASLAHLAPHVQDAILRGKWDVPFGAFFPELKKDVHQIKHFDPPEWWPRAGFHDWGSHAPAATLWAAISDGQPVERPDGSRVTLPRGYLYFYKEWYVASRTDTTKGLGLSNKELAAGMAKRADKPRLTYWTDSLPFQERGGIPMWKEYEDEGIYLQQADVSNKAVSGAAVRTRIKSNMIGFSDDCPEVWRTMVALQTHLKKPDKPDDGQEDHLPDCVFHACRTWVSARDKEEPDHKRAEKELTKPVTLRDLDLGISL